MKKIISLVLAVMLVLSALVCFSVSAADKKDPTFTADKSLITGKDDAGFYTNNSAPLPRPATRPTAAMPLPSVSATLPLL